MYHDLTRDILTDKFIERILARIERSGPDDCWEWTAGKTPYGYGRIRVPLSDNVVEYAHRLAFLMFHDQDIPAGMVIMHTCDNPPCCNPRHLKLGTFSENSLDRERKGRRIAARSNRANVSDTDVVNAYLAGMCIEDISVQMRIGYKSVRDVIDRAGLRASDRPQKVA